MKIFFNKYAYYFYALLLVLYFFNGSVMGEYLYNHFGYTYSFFIISLLIIVILYVYKAFKNKLVIVFLSFAVFIIADYTTHYLLSVEVKGSEVFCDFSEPFKGVVIERFHENLFFKNEIIVKKENGDKIKFNHVTDPVLTFTVIVDTLEKPLNSDLLFSKSAKGYGDLKFKLPKCPH
ncbi:MAG: hypothetical protein RQ735_05035 [Flavobacteriaceae bacterium]|nr:hypothetical protein [Flavobacteriaceae bacterium]